MTGLEGLAVILIDGALAGLDRLVLQQLVRDGEAAGKTADEITDDVMAVMRKAGISSKAAIDEIPD